MAFRSLPFQNSHLLAWLPPGALLSLNAHTAAPVMPQAAYSGRLGSAASQGNGQPGWPDNGAIDLPKPTGFGPGVRRVSPPSPKYYCKPNTRQLATATVPAATACHVGTAEETPATIMGEVGGRAPSPDRNEHAGRLAWPWRQPAHRGPSYSRGQQKGVGDAVFSQQLRADYVRL